MANKTTVGGCLYIGGIVGHSSSSVSYSYNRASVGPTGGQYVGGIVGQAISGCSVSYSYNVGAISGSYRLGGIVGYMSYSGNSVTYCYSSKGPSSGNTYGALVGDTAGTVTNSYYLSGLTSSKGSSQAAYYMKVYFPSTNNNFVADGSDGNGLKNGGYPRLLWECTPAKGVICYSVNGSLTSASVSGGRAIFKCTSGNYAYIYMPAYAYRNTYNITAVATTTGTTGRATWYCRNGNTTTTLLSSSSAGTTGSYTLSNATGGDMAQGRFYFSGAVQFVITGSVTKLVKL